ncbi:MAG: FlgD immunoglobulin-like domain containing protein [Candidatus Limnocylindrales bacterium]
MSRSITRAIVGALMAAAFAVTAQLAPASPAIQPARAGSTAPPKAVFIVGPTNGLTESNLADAEKMATQAEAVGMDVRRVFHPSATWDNVLANIQGANLVVYMGHGYGWPSPYTEVMKESRQNGMGLNSWADSGRDQYTYYGAIPIKDNIDLAPNAIVILAHLCYASGNGEAGMAIPSEDLARQRVDNFANGFLAAGARAVFAFGWNQKLNYPDALARSNSTMDQMFMTVAGGSPAGHVGWREARFDSERTPGAKIHLDPHSSYGYYRSLTGDLDMTAADWRSGAPPSPPPPPTEPADPPEITQLIAGPSATGVAAAAQAGAAAFHPNGDGLDEQLMLQHTVTRAAYLDATVRNSAGEVVRSYSVWSSSGTSSSRWDGRNNSGSVVPDGSYTLTYVPRDASGVVGAPVTTEALVLTAIALAAPTKVQIHVTDTDSLARATTLKVTLNQPARLTWLLVDQAGVTVRTVRSDVQTAAGATSFAWDGRSDAGAWVPDGRYRSVVSAQTGLGTYQQERQVFVGEFQVTPSIASPARGGTLTLTMVSSEGLDRNPTVLVTQPGIAPWKVTAKHVSGKKYKVTLTLKTGGGEGKVDFLISGIDTKGGRQSTLVSLPLR